MERSKTSELRWPKTFTTFAKVVPKTQIGLDRILTSLEVLTGGASAISWSLSSESIVCAICLSLLSIGIWSFPDEVESLPLG